MSGIIASVQQSGGGRRQGRHKAVPAWRARARRLRLLALVPPALAATLVAANLLAAQHDGTDAASTLVLTVSPSITPATRPPDHRVARAAPRASTLRPSSTFSTARNGVACTGPGTKAALTRARRVQTEVGPVLRTAGARVAFAAQDSATGVVCTARASTHFESASLVKAAIVAALLVQRHDAHRSLSTAERALARRAMTLSDNEAASALWRTVGGASGMRRFFTRAGMTHALLDSGGYWGLTRVTAVDELTLLRHVTRRGLLARPDRAYLQDLMAAVIREQRWGVPAGAPGDARVGNKNGWLLRPANAWRVHSIGWVELPTTTYDVVLLSDGAGSFSAGVDRLDALAAAVHRALGTGRS